VKSRPDTSTPASSRYTKSTALRQVTLKNRAAQDRPS
jgi:hypothetical protein